MTDEKLVISAGIIVSSALYIGLVFAGGLYFGSRPVAFMAAATAGLTYLCYSVQFLAAPAIVSTALYLASVVFGVAAGVTLLFV